MWCVLWPPACGEDGWSPEQREKWTSAGRSAYSPAHTAPCPTPSLHSLPLLLPVRWLVRGHPPARSRASAAMRTDRYLLSTCGEPTWASLRWVLFVAVSAHKWYWAAGAVFPRILPVLVPKFKEGNARGTRRSGPPVRPPWDRRIGTVLSLR